MISIIGGDLYQWDVGRSVKFQDNGLAATELHFANKGDSKAVKMKIDAEGTHIPDYLLCTGKQLRVYAVNDGVTVEFCIFPVTKRERPENYVYEDDKRNYIYELIQSAEDAAAEAERVIKELKTARDNGEFNGPKGEKGDPGRSMLVVTIDGDTASHNPSQILAHIAKGGLAVLRDNEEYYALLSVMNGTATFGTLGTEQTGITYFINADGDAMRKEQNYGGGGSSVLVVTIVDFDEQGSCGTASHIARQIYDHVQAGGTVVLHIDGGSFIQLQDVNEGYAVFSSFSGEELILTTYCVGEDGTIDRFEKGVASLEYVDRSLGYIDNALQNIIALQEGLLNIFTFTLGGSPLIAVAGITWDDWCKTSYNTVGVYIDERGHPCDSNEDIITLDGESGVRGLDNIGPYDYFTL